MSSESQHYAPQHERPEPYERSGHQPAGHEPSMTQSAAQHPAPYGKPLGRWEYVPASPQDAQNFANARKSSEIALILGILGVTVLPILGPFALWQATKSENLGGEATAGKVLGWVGIVLLAFAILWIVLMMVFMGVVISTVDSSVRSMT